jgi:MFS family permease
LPQARPSLRSDQWHAVSASFLGWTLDAFDFFVLVFLVDTLAAHFHVTKSAIIWTLTATLAMRPVGAVIFGLLADRYGRRKPLMANVVFFSVIELLCGFAPSYTVFLILRTIYGIGMGGEWGVGASLAMENAPSEWRGILSGILQSGYSIGYLLAAVAARFVLPAWGWRAMFWVGGAPALLAFYIRLKVRESEAWKEHRAPTVGFILQAVRKQWKLFSYLVLLMTDDVPISRHAGFVSGLFEVGAWVHAGYGFLHRYFVQHWSGAGVDCFRTLFRAVGTPLQHDGGTGAVAAGDSRLGVRPNACHSRSGGFFHAGRSSGGMGHYSSASE